jgi:hypothetical protein
MAASSRSTIQDILHAADPHWPALTRWSSRPSSYQIAAKALKLPSKSEGHLSPEKRPWDALAATDPL